MRLLPPWAADKLSEGAGTTGDDGGGELALATTSPPGSELVPPILSKREGFPLMRVESEDETDMAMSCGSCKRITEPTSGQSSIYAMSCASGECCYECYVCHALVPMGNVRRANLLNSVQSEIGDGICRIGQAFVQRLVTGRGERGEKREKRERSPRPEAALPA